MIFEKGNKLYQHGIQTRVYFNPVKSSHPALGELTIIGGGRCENTNGC